MRKKSEALKAAILRVLSELGEPAGAARIFRQLTASGVRAQPRTIRFYLMQLDHEGLTRFVGRRRGREITARGREELSRVNVVEKVGFVATRIDELVYRMDFDLDAQEGTIIANIAMLPDNALARALEDMRPVFARGWGMGNRIAVAHAGEMLGGLTVPAGATAVATVCSVTANGILLKHGIPVVSRFGGLLEIADGHPLRFVELMEYRGTTMDPLETFIRAGMTRVRECARTGHGLIGASFREVPSAALNDLIHLRKKMRSSGLGGVLEVGYPNQPLFDIPVSEGRTGLVVVGGLNPIAALREAGVPVEVRSLAGLVDFARFEPFDRIRDRFPRI